MPLKHTLIAIACAMAWGFNFVVMRWGLQDFPPILMTALRFTFAALPLVFFVKLPKSRAAFIAVALYGFFQFAAQFALIFSGMQAGFPTGLTSLVVQSQALFTVIVAAFWLGEKTVRQQWFGIWLALFGITFAGVNYTVVAGLSIGLPAFLMVVGAGVCWASANIQTRRMNSKAETSAHWTTMVAWGSLLSILPLFALSLAWEGADKIAYAIAHAPLNTWLWTAFQGWVVTCGAFGMWAWLIPQHGAGRVAPFTLLVPVAGFSGSSLLLGEPMEWWKWLSFAIVIMGLLLNQTAKKQ